MNDELAQQNTGFIAVDPKPEDFVAGGETGILDTPVLPSCNWTTYLPTDAGQLMKDSKGNSHGDTNACVSFAGKQSIETQLNFQIQNGLLSEENHAWLENNGYINSDGSVYISARFTAKQSKTDPNYGNSLPNVWGSLKNDGCVPESMWPMPVQDFDMFIALHGGMSQQQGWAIYYENVPQAVIDLGKEFTRRFPVLYEWIVSPTIPASGEKLKGYLSVSPIEIATAVCSGWNTDNPIKACGPGTQHATLLFSVESNEECDILDHYVPWVKHFAPNYTITYGMRGVVGQAIVAPQPTFHYTFTKQLRFNGTANDTKELAALQEALQTLKSPSTSLPYMKAGVFGPFGPQTKIALGQFQTDNGITDSDGQGTNFGPASRAKMNALLIANK